MSGYQGRHAAIRIQAIVLWFLCSLSLLGTMGKQAARAGLCRPLEAEHSLRRVIRLPPTTQNESATPAFKTSEFRLGKPLASELLEGGVAPGPQFRQSLDEILRKVRADHAHYYSPHTLRDLTLGVALAAPLANTSLDHDFRNWWQDDVRTSQTDRAASCWKVFGEGAIFLPAMACLSLAGHVLDDRPVFELAGDFGSRATRAYVVGAPSVLCMQVLLGASRPGETDDHSRWKPFDDSNAVSGHAFVGSVPFITAAHMTESRAAQALLYFGSACTAWSRVNDDAHYLSQAVLGWYMAYLACRSVHATNHNLEPWSLVPLTGPELSGLGLVWRR